MTPANPDNSKPFIYRIADALGITHLVVAVQHSHLMSEIEGLVSALDGKANAVGSGSSGQIVVAQTDGTLVRANKTLEAIDDAIAGKMDTKTIDSTPSNNADHLISSKGVKDALANKHDLVGQTISLVINGQEIEIESADVPNLLRALSDPDTTPTTNSNKLITSGGVKAALGGKADTNHTHTPTDVQGVIPSFVEWTGQTLDLDAIIDGTLGMVRLMIYNNDSTDTTFGDLFESLESLPIHLNANAATVIETQHYALCTIYKMDKSQTPSEHDHDLCYFITLDGVFDDGNQAV